MNSRKFIKNAEQKQKPLAAPVKHQATRFVYRTAQWYYSLHVRSVNMHAVTEPFSKDFEFAARHDSYGFRTPEYTTAHPTESLRIVIIGDSYIWGQGVALEESYSYQLNRLLNEKYSGSDRSAEVTALKVCGSRLIDNYIGLKAHAMDLEPNLVVIQFFVIYSQLDNSVQSYQFYQSLDELAPALAAPWFHMSQNTDDA